MYTQVVADLYSGQEAGGQPDFRSARDPFSRTSLGPCGPAVPFGFCCGGFSSTAGYVPGNEAQVRRLKRLATSRLIISSKARLRFYPLPLKMRALRPSLEAKPFGFSARCKSCNSRLLPLSNGASPHRLPLLSLVTMPVSTATRVWVIRWRAEQVKQKIL
ncbi:MAG TPA: hypothetical protein VF791_20415 [Pyrinomonadaceae bacterium]